METDVRSVKTGTVFPSKTNPRSSSKGSQALADLASSVKERGILQPLIVRPKPPGFEVVAGHRRLEAAKQAGLPEIPVRVVKVDDLGALEIQVIENLQREDMHPLDEAEGFRALLKTGKYDVANLSAKLGKSQGFIYARLKLNDLPLAAKKAFLAGDLVPGIAILIARIPVAKLREEAWRTLGRGDWTVAAAQKWVRENAMLELGAAPFNPADKKLVAKAGACEACPKRTGNQVELFPDVKAKDICTDHLCYAAKCDADWEIRTEKAAAAGIHVLEGAELRKVFPGDGDRVAYGCGYVDLKEQCYADEKSRTWAAILGKHKPAVHLARDPRRGIHELVTTEDLKAKLKEIGLGRLIGDDRKTSDQDSAAKKAAKIRKAAALAAQEDIVQKASKAALDVPFLRRILMHVDTAMHADDATRMKEPELKAQLVRLLTDDDVKAAAMSYSDNSQGIKDDCERWGVNWEAHFAQAKANARQKGRLKAAKEPAKEAPEAAEKGPDRKTLAAGGEA